MYHCSTMPMSAHIANGMFGAVVIDPPRPAAASTASTCSCSPSCTSAPTARWPTSTSCAAERPGRRRVQRLPDQYATRAAAPPGPASGCGSGCSTPARTGPRPSTSSAGSSTPSSPRAPGSCGSDAARPGRRRTGAAPAAGPGRVRRAGAGRAGQLPVRQPRDGRRREGGPRAAEREVTRGGVLHASVLCRWALLEQMALDATHGRGCT